MTVRRHYYISGSVQGVGFRYRAYHAAHGLGLTGFVKNLYDGRVEMEIQGDQELIPRMLAEINSGHFIYIEDVDVSQIPIVEDESDFVVV